MSKEIEDLKAPKPENSGGNELLQFFLRVILLGAGLFMLSKRVMVHSSSYKSEEDLINNSNQTALFLLVGGIVAIAVGLIMFFSNIG